jgi:hypothetical protein
MGNSVVDTMCLLLISRPISDQNLRWISYIVKAVCRYNVENQHKPMLISYFACGKAVTYLMKVYGFPLDYLDLLCILC